MPEQFKLFNRLKHVVSYIPKGVTFADIGSDHAYLPVYACLQEPNTQAIAVEVNEGPFQSAKTTVEKYGFKNRVDVRLGSGLQPLKAGEVQAVVIAGMGGSLIESILEEGKHKLTNVQRIIAQPNVDEQSVRQWMANHHYRIVHEHILEENGHIYEVIVGDLHSQPSPLTKKQLLFGPILKKNKSPAFYKKWHIEKSKRHHVIQQLQSATTIPLDKLEHFKKELAWIEEELQSETD